MENHSQPLSAYQYFENVRNFLVAVEELKLPAFEASDIERVNKHLYLGIRYQVNWVLIPCFDLLFRILWRLAQQLRLLTAF